MIVHIAHSAEAITVLSLSKTRNVYVDLPKSYQHLECAPSSLPFVRLTLVSQFSNSLEACTPMQSMTTVTGHSSWSSSRMVDRYDAPTLDPLFREDWAQLWLVEDWLQLWLVEDWVQLWPPVQLWLVEGRLWGECGGWAVAQAEAPSSDGFVVWLLSSSGMAPSVGV